MATQRQRSGLLPSIKKEPRTYPTPLGQELTSNIHQCTMEDGWIDGWMVCGQETVFHYIYVP
jgi:hypothetical protein